MNHWAKIAFEPRSTVRVDYLRYELALLMKFSFGAIRFSSISLAVLIVGASGTVLATEAAGSKMMLNNMIALEHLEVITPLRGAQYAQGYFYLWNGTEKSIYLEKITNLYGQSFILQKSDQAIDVKKWNNVILPKSIPPKSEFTAQAELFRLLIDAKVLQNNKGTKLPVLFEFADGKQIEIFAPILPFGVDPTDHHHGLTDDQ